jgi:hypothetical protein
MTFYLRKMMSVYLQKVISRIAGFCWHLEGQGRQYQDPDPERDPLVRVTDPRIRIKMSRIHNTALERF